ncbi:MAG: TetR/AcrR family transcriptional regulator [Bacillota bacterium]|nr:TetR/AcrR family transcriptional regulator [Bacillota bacterium]
MKDEHITPIRTERRDAAENRQRILNTAHKLFEQHGVEQVSMNQIANEAQIGSGTLYRRYRNKGEVCLDLIKDHVVLLFEDIEAFLEENRGIPASQRFKGLLHLFIQFREKKSQLLKGVEESVSSNQSKPLTLGPIYQELHQLFFDLFEEMKGSNPSRPDSIFLADMMLRALSSESYLFQREVRGYSPEIILEQLCLMFL